MKLGEKFPEKLAKKAPPGGRKFIAEYEPGEEVEGIFLVKDAQLKTAKSGSAYLSATLGDKTGSMDMKKWDSNEKEFAILRPGGYVKVKGRVEEWQGARQMKVEKLREAIESEVNAADYLPVSSRSLEEMEKEFFDLLATIKDPDILRAMEAVFRDEAVWKAFRQSPAANTLHHAWIGGLLEHTLSSARTAEALCQQHKGLRRDLLIAGMLLHDVGKIEELSPAAGFSYTDAGGLLGHILLGSLIVERHLLGLEKFPASVRQHLLHVIASHHGTVEHGAIKMPATPEALAIHHIECMDAKLQGIRTALDQDSNPKGSWTDFLRIADGRVFKG